MKDAKRTKRSSGTSPSRLTVHEPTFNESDVGGWMLNDGANTSRKFDLESRLMEFASAVIDLSESLPSTRAGNHVAGQILRSGTSPYPNHGEAEAAESRNDFIHKLKICLKGPCKNNFGISGLISWPLASWLAPYRPTGRVCASLAPRQRPKSPRRKHRIYFCTVPKELRETRRWTRLVKRKAWIKDETTLLFVLSECDELIRIFHSSIRTARRNCAKSETAPPNTTEGSFDVER